MSEQEERQKITPESSLRELFDEIRPDEGCRVVPVTLGPPDANGKVDLMIAITGKEADASVIMANLMTYVDQMFAVAQQKQADAKILGADGRPASNEPSILVPDVN